MLRVHILTEGFVSPNGRAFLFPLIVHRRALREAGIRWHGFTAVGEALYDCDVLIVDSKFHRLRWIPDETGVIAEFQRFKARIDRVYYFDTTDSAGWLQTALLPIVDGYYKNQLLRDRSHYLRPLYGHRLYADYYHRTQDVVDAEPEYSKPVDDRALLGKLGVSWKSGLADYALTGPLRMAIYGRLPVARLLRFPRRLVAPSAERSIDIQCRMGTPYNRASVAFQRREIGERLADHVPTTKLRRCKYIQELASSKIVVSPFGFGEITLKDFEVFLTGGVLLKPDMSHLETWPDLFRADETIITHRWDLSDLTERIDAALADHRRRIEIARAGQTRYWRYTGVEEAPGIFCKWLQEILAVAPTPQAA